MTMQFNAGDTVKVKVDYDAEGAPVLTEGRVLLIRPSTHPIGNYWVAEVDIGTNAPRVCYFHDLERWQGLAG